MQWPVTDVRTELERVGFSCSMTGRGLTSRRTDLPLRELRKGNWWQDWIFSEIPSTPRICLDGVSDHGARTWGNKAASRALGQSPNKVLSARGTLESCPKLPLLLPLLFCAQALFASTGLSGRDTGHPASDDRAAGLLSHPRGPEPVHPLGTLSRPRAGLPFSGKQLKSCQWVGARSSDCLSYPRPTDQVFTSLQLINALVLVGDFTLDCADGFKIVSSQVFFDVCSPPSPGAVRSDFDMKAQSCSDLFTSLPASLPPSVCTGLEKFPEAGRCLSCDTKRERSLGVVPCVSMEPNAGLKLMNCEFMI